MSFSNLDARSIPANENLISVAADLPTVVNGFHVWESGLYRIDGAISSANGHKRADGAQVYIYGKSLQGDTLTFTGGADGTFTAASDAGGGKTLITLSDTTGFADNDVIFLPKTTVYDQEQRYTISSLIANTSFKIDTAYISTDSGTFYKGQMFTDDETATSQENALLRIENVGLFISGGGRLLDFPDGGNTRGTIWFFGCFIVGDASNYCEMGTVDNYNFFTMSSIPICISWDDGVYLNDINQTIVNSQMTAWKDNDGILIKGGAGTFGLFSVTGAGSVMQPSATESCFNFNPSATYTNPVVISGVVNTGTFFAAGSLDSTSIYLKVDNVGGVPNSSISAQIDVGANSTDTDIPAAGAHVLVTSANWASSELERVTADVTTASGGVVEYIGLDDEKLKVSFSLSIDPASAGTKDLGARLMKICAGATTVTFTNGTNIINETSTPRANGDVVSFYDTAGTLPAELRKDVAYYVVNKATNTFQVSYTAGGSAVAFTDDGTPTNSYKVAILNGIPSTSTVSAGSPQSLTRFGVLAISTGDKAGVVVWNVDDATDLTGHSGGLMI